MKYQIVVIKEPYRYYEVHKQTRQWLSEIFINQLKGYKEYYPKGVCPISEYDFFTNHIAIVDSQTDEVLCSYKIIKYSTCIEYQKKFPLFLLLGEDYPEHSKEVRSWLGTHINCGYNHSWTINPNLSKEVKKELVDLTFTTLASFYKNENIFNMIDVSITTFKIEKIKEWMGNKYLAGLAEIVVKDYGHEPGVIMINEGLKFSDEFQFAIRRKQELWDNRVEISQESIQKHEREIKKKIAA